MKKIILISFLFTKSFCLNAQCDVTKKLQTNPIAPLNVDLNPRLKPGSSTVVPVNEFKNTFNWGAYNSNGFLNIPLNDELKWEGRTNFTMSSPFNSSTAGDYTYLYISSSTPFENRPWQWNEGWELMLLNTGFFPNGEKYNEKNSLRILHNDDNLLSLSRVPYFALYNRYSSKLRLFYNTRQDYDVSPANHVKTTLSFGPSESGYVNGTLRNLANYDRTLDEKTEISYINTNNPNPGSTDVWGSSDFQLGYDPCVCSFSSEMLFTFNLINSWNVNLFGRSIENTIPLSKFDNDFLTNNFIEPGPDNTPTGKWGSYIYKDVSAMYDKYKIELEDHDLKLAEYNKTENLIAREMINLSKNLLINGTIGALLPSAGVTSAVKKFMTSYDSNFDANNAADMSKGIIKTATSLLGSGHDFLTQHLVGNEIMNKPVKPTMPTVTISEMRIMGEITQSNELRTKKFYTPGSFNATTNANELQAYNYPIYNKPTGIFALLRTPKLQIYDNIVPNSLNDTFHTTNLGWGDWTDWSNTLNGRKKRNRTQQFKHFAEIKYQQDLYFKLKENLLYKFNNHLDIDFNNSDTRVQILVELEPENLDDSYYLSNEVLENSNNNLIKTKNQVISVDSTNLVVFSHIQKSSTQSENVILASSWIPIQNVGFELFGGTLENTAYFEITKGEIKETQTEIQLTGTTAVISNTETETFITERLNRNKLYFEQNNSDQFINIGVKPEIADALKFKIKTVKLKIMPSLTFLTQNSNGDKNMTTQVFTYLLKNNEIDLIESKGEYLTPTTVSNIKKYNTSKIILSNEKIEPNDPFVSEVIGNQININANNFIINGEITSTPGYNVNLYYRENIEFGNEVIINPNINIEKKLDFFGCGLNEEATPTQLENFCKGNTKEYQADQMLHPRPITKQTDTLINNSTKRKSQLVVIPNPSDLETTVYLFDMKDEQYDCAIFDLTGKCIYSIKIEPHGGKITEQINTSELASGIYFIVVSNKDFRITKKLIIEHN